MGIKYEFAPDLHKLAVELSKSLFPHIDIMRLKCFRSYGSTSRNTIARCHTVGKLMQLTMDMKAHYGIEFLSENFDNLSEEEQVKTIIHELMHIPKSFGGGFRHHDHVCDKNINIEYNKWLSLKNNESQIKTWW